jgi:hypothetical protein
VDGEGKGGSMYFICMYEDRTSKSVKIILNRGEGDDEE